MVTIDRIVIKYISIESITKELIQYFIQVNFLNKSIHFNNNSVIINELEVKMSYTCIKYYFTQNLIKAEILSIIAKVVAMVFLFRIFKINSLSIQPLKYWKQNYSSI